MKREEIAAVVRDAVRDLCGMGPWAPHPEVCDAVADRVADKLALFAADRRLLIEIRNFIQYFATDAKTTEHVALLDRLIGAQP